jgi:hypothetical protein
MVIGTIAGVVSALCAVVSITNGPDVWQRPASAPPGGSETRPPVEGEAPETGLNGANDGASSSPSPEGADGAPTESREPNVQAPEPAASKVESLINYRAVPSGSVPVMAIALDGDSSDVELMEAALVQGVSSAELRLVPGFFKPAFRERGFLRAVYDGDTDALTSSGALAAVERILVGRVERSCRKTGQFDSDLVTCDVRLYFKVIDRHGAVANAGHFAVAGAGFSEDAARDRAVEMLVQQNGKRIISPE